MKNPPLTAAILKAIHYADLFDYPLTVEEIKRYSIDHPQDRNIKEVLSRMVADAKLIHTDNFYGLPGRGEIIKLRKRRRVSSQPKLVKAVKIAALLKFVPWIKLVGVTGALAMENSDEDDDIDLMIITSPKRLWLTRGLVVTLLRLTGQYRRPEKIKDMICPNLMIDEEALEFSERDLFTAHEIVQMRPIFERGDTYQKFINANRWVLEFLPNWRPNVETGHAPSLPEQFTQLSLLENLAYKIQLKYMRKKKTVEVTTTSVIRFHPQDIRQKVLDEYRKRVYTLTK